MNVNIIVSINNDNVIGYDDKLLVESRDDMRHFYKITTEQEQNKYNVCIMGWNTWESIPVENTPLKNRYNLVITNNHCIKETEFLKQFNSYEDAIDWCKTADIGKIFVIGGQYLYNYCLNHHLKDINMIYITHFKYMTPVKIRNIKYFPEIYTFENIHTESKKLKCKLADEELMIDTDFKIYQNKNNINYQELQYLKLLKNIINQPEVDSRNSTVLSSFGERMIFDLSYGFPLLTSKRMGFKTILRELLWFIRGSTSNKELNDVNVHIWDQNASTEFLTKRGLTYQEGDLGPIYGFQWRHFGACYIDSNTDYNNKGVDQLKYVIDTIKNDPTSRRIILTAWNPCDIDKMALPPCHVMCQFHVNQSTKTLDCQLYQRSGDMFLGVPFNIASYSLLTIIISHLTGYKPGKFIHILGDAHIYINHIESVKKQLVNPTYAFPFVTINDTLTDIDNINENDFTLNNYKSNSRITADMIS